MYEPGVDLGIRSGNFARPLDPVVEGLRFARAAIRFDLPGCWTDIHLQSLVLGILIGLLLGPLLEAAVAFRRFLIQAALGSAKVRG